MNSSSQIQQRWFWVLLTVVSGLWFLAWLGHNPLVIQDEGRYVGISREMLLKHEWVVPWFNGVPFFDKPILYYWLEIIAMKIVGITPFAARLPQAVLGVLGVMMTYVTATQLFGRRIGLLSWWILAVSPLYFLLAHYADMDLEVAVLMSIALMSFLLAQQPEASKPRCRYMMWLSYTCAALAILTKGFMGLALPGMVALLWTAVTGRWDVFKRLHWLAGIVILLAINVPWDLAMKMRFPDYWHYFFYRLQFARYFAHNFTHIEPFWFYLPVLLLGCLPVSILCFTRLFRVSALRLSYLRQNPNQAFFVIWFLSILLFFSIAHTKLIGYVIPLTPSIAVLSAIALVRWWQNEGVMSVWSRSVTVLGFAFFAALFALAPHFFPTLQQGHNRWYAYAIAAGFTVAMLIALCCRQSRHQRLVLVTALLSVMWMNMVVLLCPAVQRTNQQLYQEANAYITPDTKVAMYFTYIYDAPFYLKHPLILVDDWDSPMVEFEDSWHWRMQYGRQQSPQTATPVMKNDQQFRHLWHQPGRVLAFVDKSQYPRLKQHLNPRPVVVSSHYDYMAIVKPSMVYAKNDER